MKISTYIAVKVLMAIPMVLILLSVVFFVMRILPGDPIGMMVGEKTTAEEIARIRHLLGLDRPLHEQFFSYIHKMLTGDFGKSLVTMRPIMDELMDAYPTTIELTILAALIGVVIGLPMGIVSALKKDSIVDQFCGVFTFGTYSMPVFWLALLFQIFFALQLRILPVSGRIPVTMNIQRVTGLYTLDSLLTLNFNGFVESIRYLLLPSITLALIILPRISRIARANLLDQMSEDYVTTARAKGVPERTIVYRHALRNAFLPIMTAISLSVSGLLGGTVLIETIFSLPGLGRLLVAGLLDRNFPLVQAVVFIYAIVVVVINTVTDILYSVLDPRVRY